MSAPPGVLSPFPGWPDPPWRAQTSVSLLVPDPKDSSRVSEHILIDVGCGVVESLAASKIPGIENVKTLLLTHWHPDHVIGENQLGESVKRAPKNLIPIPLYCHRDTFSKVSDRYPYDMKHNFEYKNIDNGRAFNVDRFSFTPFLVRHRQYNGCVVLVCKENDSGIKIVFAWDVDTPNSMFPNCPCTNLSVFQHPAFKDADLFILDCNTWQISESRRTGHTSFLDGWEYVQTCTPKALGVIHLSGHEDEEAPDGHGFGWTDEKWVKEARAYANANPINGRTVSVLDLFQGTVLSFP